MANPSPSVSSDDPRVRAALAEFFERRDRGEKVDRQSFLSQRPEIAEALKSLLDADGDLANLQGKVSSEARTIPPDVATHSATNQNVETLPPPSGGSSPGGASSGSLPTSFGRYRVIRALGSGAMGTVYLAEDTKLHRQVALKTSSFDHDPTGELLERFYREARAAANLRSANICPVFDVDQIEGRHVISMAYIEGQPMSKSIRPDKPFSERQALLIVRKLALALQEAHDHGVIHRDLKPGNVMMDAKGEPIITDFGLARCSRAGEQARLTQSGMIIGSPAYMSPEQVEADPDKLTGATDQYSLGVILYEMLTGQIPFNGSITAIISAIITREPPPPSSHRPGLDPRVESLCLKMMAKSPEARFPNLKAAAAEMANVVKALPAGGAGASVAGARTGVSTAPPLAAKPEAPVVAATKGASTKPPVQDGAPASKNAAKPQAAGPAVESTTESNIASLTAAAKRCLARHDYDQVIQVLSPIPEARRNDEIRRLLEKARQLSDEVAFLLTEIDDALRRHDAETALQKASALKKIQPKHPRLREVDEQCQYGGKGKRGRGQRSVFGGSGGSWMPWGVVAFGVAVFAAMFWAVTVYLRVGDATVKVTILDPDVKVGIQGRTINLESGREPVKVRSGEGTLTITYGDLEFQTPKFTLKKGENPAVVVELVDGMLEAKFGEEKLGEWPVDQKKLSPSEVLTSTEYEWAEPENLGPGVNSGDREMWPSLTADELTIVFVRENDIYQSRRQSIDMPFPNATRLEPPVSRGNTRHKGVSISGDGLLLVVESDQGEGTDTDIFLYERKSVDDSFQGPTPLPSPVSSSQGDHGPTLSSDGLTLTISSERKGGRGGIDLVRFTRASRQDQFSGEENLGPVVNTAQADFGGATTADGLVMFRATFQSPPTNNAAEDGSNIASVMCVRKSIDNPFESAIPLSGRLESYSPVCMRPSPSGHRMYFISRRAGGQGQFDLYVARRVPKSRPASAAGGGLLPTEPSQVLTSPEYVWAEPENLGSGVNTAEREMAPALTADELSLFFIRNGDVYQSRRKSIDEPFPTASRMGPPISRANSRQSGVSVSGDGLLLVVGSDRGEGTDTDIYLFERESIEDPFQGPKPLPSPVSSSQGDHHPNLSSDGLSLVVSSDRKGGLGLPDLIRFTRGSRSENFTNEVNLGPVVNTPRADYGGAMSADGLAMFRATFNTRPTSRTDEDDSNITSVICVRKSTDQPFEKAIPLSGTLESYLPVAATPSPSGHRLYFMSRKPGGKGLSDLYVARRVPKARPAPTVAAEPASAILTSPDWEWTEPENLGSGVNTAEREMSPSLTADEKILVFTRKKDVYLSRRNSIDEPFPEAKWLPNPISKQSSEESGVSITGDGLLLAVASDRGTGGKVKGEDIFFSERKSIDDSFSEIALAGSPVSSALPDRTPVLSPDGLSLVICSTRRGGAGASDFYRFTRKSRSEPFGNEEHLGGTASTPNIDDGGWMSPDGLVLFRTTNVKASDADDATVVICTRRSTSEPFTDTQSFGPRFEKYPPRDAVASHDGKRLYFQSRRPDGKGEFDLWMSRRVPKENRTAAMPPSELFTSPDWEWTEPENLGDGINTAGRELSAALTADEKTLFFTRGGDVYTSRRDSVDAPFPAATSVNVGKGRSEKGHISVTGDGLVLVYSATPGKRKNEDIFMTVRKSVDEPFGPAEELPAPVNSSFVDRSPQISSDGLSLVIASSRAGAMSDLYRFTRPSRSEPFGNEEHLGPVASTDKLDVGGWMSPDGLVLFRFTSSKVGDDDDGIAAICTRRTASGPFTDIHSFGSRLEVYPPRMAVASLDGKRLYFQSRRPGGKGDFDLWTSRRVPKGKGVATNPPPAVPVPPAVPKLSAVEIFTSPDYEWSKPVSLGPGATSNLRERSPSLTADEKTMVFIRNGAVWIARRNAMQEPFATAEVLPDSINEPGSRNITVSMTGDGLTIVFCSNRTGSESDDVWMSERKSLDDPFGPPQRLSEKINSSLADRTPRLSFDGLTLLVSTQRSGGHGRADLYEYTRASRQDPFDHMTNLGPPVNTELWDACGGLSADGLIVFREMSGDAADDAGARMAYHVRKSKTDPWGPSQALGPPFDGMSALGAWLSTDGRRLYFAGVETRRENDLFMAERVLRKR